MELVGRPGPAGHGRRAASPRCCGRRRCLHAFGITAWQDAHRRRATRHGRRHPPPTSPPPRDGALTARVVGALWWDRERGAEQIPELVDRRERADARAGFRADAA